MFYLLDERASRIQRIGVLTEVAKVSELDLSTFTWAFDCAIILRLNSVGLFHMVQQEFVESNHFLERFPNLQ